MTMLRQLVRWTVPLALCLGGAGVLAQGFPAKPVRLVVPFAAGGAIDLMGRTYGQRLTEIWKQQVIVDNRAGAGGNIGADIVAKSPPDGYTLLINSSAQAISAGLYRKLPFDPQKDFVPVTQLTPNFFMLVCNARLPVSSMKDLLSLAKAHPGKLNFGSTGMGSAPHLAGELFKSMAALDVVHVPYKGDASLTPALLSDEVQFAFLPMAAFQQISAGKLKALAVTGAKRAGTAPEVFTVAEAGLSGYEFSGWVGVFAPAGTPRGIVNQISADFARVLGMPEVQERIRGWGYEPVGNTPEEFAARYKADIGVYARIIREGKVPLVD
jgi:tripartite-type tricarboxylate transporter receptor subunit TctC